MQCVPRKIDNAVFLLGNQPETCLFNSHPASSHVQKVHIQKLYETNHHDKIQPVYWAAMDEQLLTAVLKKQQLSVRE